MIKTSHVTKAGSRAKIHKKTNKSSTYSFEGTDMIEKSSSRGSS